MRSCLRYAMVVLFVIAAAGTSASAPNPDCPATPRLKIIYVAQGGIGDGSSAENPLGRIQTAADYACPWTTVSVSPGLYREQVTVRRSGTPAHPIVFMSPVPGGAIIMGTDPVGVFTKESASAAWRVALSAAPMFPSTQGQSEQCFARDTRLIEARWPYTPPEALSSPALAVVGEAEDDCVRTSESQKCATTTGNGGSVANHTAVISNLADNRLPLANWRGATIHLLTRNGYSFVTGTVVANTSSNLTVRYPARQPETGDVIVPGSQFFLAGIPAALTQAGEWVRDNSLVVRGTSLVPSQDLLVRAPGDMDPNTAGIECKQRDFAFDLTNQHDIQIDGFGIKAATITTDLNAKRHYAEGIVAPARDIVFSRLTIESPNSIGVLDGYPDNQWSDQTGAVLSGNRLTLQDSTIRHSDANGVSVIGVGNRILRNTITDSDLSGCSCAGVNTGWWGTYSKDHEIAYNTIRRSGRALIRLDSLQATSPGTGRVHHNLLDSSTLQTFDQGAIYTYQNDPGSFNDQTGVEIDHNRVTAATVGIYLDNASTGLIVHHNLIIAAGEPGLTTDNNSAMLPNGGTHHLIVNNTVLAMPPNVHAIADGMNQQGANASYCNQLQNGCDGNGEVFENNIFRYDLHGVNPISTRVTRDHNLFWNGTGNVCPTITDDAAHPNTSVCGDPMFMNLANGNLALQSSSPAIGKGVLIPGVTEASGAPDIGALEQGAPAWLPNPGYDATPPSIIVTTPAQGDTYALGERVKAAYHCADDDGGSGIVSCIGISSTQCGTPGAATHADCRNRERLDTTSAGQKILTIAARDFAGNQTIVTRTYTVVTACAPAGCE